MSERGELAQVHALSCRALGAKCIGKQLGQFFAVVDNDEGARG